MMSLESILVGTEDKKFENEENVRVQLRTHVSVRTKPESERVVTKPDPNPTRILFFMSEPDQSPTQLI